MIPRPIGLGARLAALHAASFGGIGIYVPFFPIWLESRGLPASWIGIVLALPIVVRVLVTAPLMTLADRSMGARRLIAAACLGVSVIYLTLLAAGNPVVITVLVIFMAVAQAPIIPAADLVTIQAIRREPRLDYGRLRLWGSIAFLIASIGGGYLLEVLPADAVIWFLFSLAICAMATAWAVVPDSAAAHVDAGERPPASAASGKLPLALWFVIGAGACTQASHGALYAFGSIHWRDLGFSSATIGLLWAIGVVAEILVFAFLGRGVGRGSAAVGLVLVGAGASIFRSAALAAEPGLATTFALQALHGLTFGATHLGTMGALAHLAPDGARGRAQGLMASAHALAMASATGLSGLVFRAAGPTVFLAMVPLAAAGFAFALLALRAARAQPHKAAGGG
jgi:MFS transporter, PPP family, 3-phenylpropionic acid transporter